TSTSTRPSGGCLASRSTMSPSLGPSWPPGPFLSQPSAVLPTACSPPQKERRTTMSHFIYLVRHGEQQDAEHGLPDGPLSPRGQRQATLIADRLSGVPFTGAWHSPLQRAEATALAITDRL